MAKITPWYLFGEKDPDRLDRAQDKFGFKIEINGDYVRSAGYFSRNFLAKRVADAGGGALVLDDNEINAKLFKRIGSYRPPFNLHFINQLDWNVGDYQLETATCNDRTQKSLLIEAFLAWARVIEEAHENN